MLVCETCHGSNIETKMWVDPNTKVVGDGASDGDSEDNYCNDCMMHVDFIDDSEIKKEKTTLFFDTGDYPEFIQNINWELLRKQKASLYSLSTTLIPDSLILSNHVEGVIRLIDAIQDYAVDVMGISEKEVFDLLEEE